ncbi:MAG: ribosome-associated translation inhibitor RaiA [Planctomycetes bacterium]|nr:ribosome-associated translation inhibitor RaiA [Planctomycetota bacterium]
MNITISGRHVEVSSAMRDFVEEKVERLERYLNRIRKIDVVMSVEAGKSTVELIVSTKRGQNLVAQAGHDDMYAAMDLVLDKVERQLTKVKEKLKSHRLRKAEPEPGSVRTDAASGEEAEETYDEVVERMDIETAG